MVEEMSDKSGYADRSINDLLRYNTLSRVATVNELDSLDELDDHFRDNEVRRVIVKVG